MRSPAASGSQTPLKTPVKTVMRSPAASGSQTPLKTPVKTVMRSPCYFKCLSGHQSDSDRDLEDSHVCSQSRDPAVRDKRRSPPSNRSPSSQQRNPHHSTEEQESPERVVQKEKLHAELKQVLSQKRSHLRESTCKPARPEMDSEPTDQQTVSSSLLNSES
ncbi:hypothetical protein CgunFtcFv8_011116 [Champsocephalus gunnari]|uniref:Uncharacterized protein n=1 Tax=Champsocephalus gunnari TaxID=52237 RepID=A0AAN8DWD0_CHAGU|nr:hypothetical protein CgunFtcFv8_011116 [Champsocephalus gunnari]